MAKCYSTVSLDHTLLIQSQVDGCWIVSSFLLVTDDAAVCYQFLCGCVFSVLLGVYLGVELLDQMITPSFEELLNSSKSLCFFSQGRIDSGSV